MWKNKSINELTTMEMCDLIVQLRDFGVRRISFSGGESTLRTDLPDLVSKAHEVGFKNILVATNGLSLSDRRAQELLNNGCNRITISIDGIGNVHDEQRGIKGAFEKSMKTIRMLIDLRNSGHYDLDIELETTITQHNLADFDEVLKLSKELKLGWVMSVFETDSFQFKDTNYAFDLRITDYDELARAIHKLHQMKRNYPMSPIISHVALERVKRYLENKNARDLKSNIPCTAGFTAIYVDACGNVFPGCWAQKPIGNIREKKLREVVNIPEFRATLKKMFVKECPTCPNSIIWGAWYYMPTLFEEGVWRLRFMRLSTG